MTDFADWSVTAGSNTDVDGVDIAEGCSPGTINNAIRAVMANLAAFRDLTGGAKVSAGTADVQTLTTGLSLSAYQQGILIGFEAGAALTNTGAMTMNIDAIGAKSVKLVDGSNPAAGAVTAGGIYMLAYESGSDTLLLLNPTPSSGQTQGDVLDDLNTLGVVSADGEVIVGTGAGAFAYESGATLRTSVGVGTGDSPQLTGIELGHASDTTLTRKSAGVMDVEGNAVPAVASVVAGDILYASGAQAYARLAKGSDDQVLTLASGVPSWAAAAGGAWTEILPRTSVGTSTTYAITGLSGYSTILVLWVNLSSDTSTRSPKIELGVSGPTYRTSGYDSGIWGAQETPTWSFVNSTDEIDLTTSSLVSGEVTSGWLMIHNFGDAANSEWHGQGGWLDSGALRVMQMFGQRPTAEAYDAIKFKWSSSGNFDDGHVTVLGLT